MAKLHSTDITTVLPTLEPSLILPKLAIAPLQNGTGRDLKALEDQLDSLICAYVAAHWWYWGRDRNWVLGNGQEGYIVVPAPRNKPQPPMAQ
ncbi:MAG: hypothetical protein HC890_17395 [Chloroflexaceae bacterium]|nr:hypothetical protein [Chloroflexaceae bacterium]